MKKRSFILLELMVALGLTAILLSVLFRFFAGSVRIDQQIDQARSVLFQRQHLQTRLSMIFTSVVPRSSLSNSTGSSFYTLEENSPGIVIVFDNGIDPEPLFSGPVLGKIFIDADQRLSLIIWPLEKSQEKYYRKETLLPHVQKIRFQFLAKKNFQNPDPKAISINDSIEWRTNWPQNRWDIPSMIRFVIREKDQETGFAFHLPLIEPIVTYHEQGAKG